MTLPKAVQAQLEAAEAMLADMNKPADDMPQANASQSDNAAQPAPEQAPTATTEQPASPQPSPVKNDDATWEQRYKPLQGLFNSRVHELQTSNKALTQQVQQLTEKLESVVENLSRRPDTPIPVADPKDVENFGQDLVEMVQRQAAAAISGLIAKVDGVVKAFEKRLAAVEQQLSGTSQAVTSTAEEVFFSKLTQLVPDWEEINADQKFLDWLAEEDPVYGVPRQAALNAAHKALDVKRVANVFNTFKALFRQPKQSAAPKSVEKQVSPSTSATAGQTVQQEKPVITQEQIQAFYRDVAQNKYRGREAEMARLEAMINEAIAEGRVR